MRLTGNSSQGSKLLNSPEIRFQAKQGLPGIEIQMSPVDNPTGLRIITNGFSSPPAPIYVKDVTNDHRKTSYKFTVIEGDRVSALRPLMEEESGRKIYRTVPDENDPSRTKNYNWKPNYVPDMGALQKQLINDSKSRIIIIATPYELEQINPVPNYYFGDSSPSKSPLSMSASIGKVRVSEGSRSGAGNIIDRELKTSQKEPVIFVIDFLGLKPNNIGSFKQDLK